MAIHDTGYPSGVLKLSQNGKANSLHCIGNYATFLVLLTYQISSSTGVKSLFSYYIVGIKLCFVEFMWYTHFLLLNMNWNFCRKTGREVAAGSCKRWEGNNKLKKLFYSHPVSGLWSIYGYIISSVENIGVYMATSYPQ